MKAAGAAIAPDAVNLLQHFSGITASDTLNPFGLFFADDRITAFLNDLSECDVRSDPRYIGDGFHELADFREFEAGIRKDGRHIRVHLADNMQKDG